MNVFLCSFLFSPALKRKTLKKDSHRKREWKAEMLKEEKLNKPVK